MWLAPFLLLATTFVHPSKQQDGNTSTTYPGTTYPNAISPNPAAAVDATFSPPYYPSPWTSGAGDWASAYAKATAFVSQLTLIEKINLTTGVGYVSEAEPRDKSPNPDPHIDGKASVASVKMGLYPGLGFEACACRTLRRVSDSVRTLRLRETW